MEGNIPTTNVVIAIVAVSMVVFFIPAILMMCWMKRVAGAYKEMGKLDPASAASALARLTTGLQSAFIVFLVIAGILSLTIFRYVDTQLIESLFLLAMGYALGVLPGRFQLPGSSTTSTSPPASAPKNNKAANR